MTATPESLLDEVMDNVVAHEECDCLHCDTLRTDIRQAVEAYGRACRLEELRRRGCEKESKRGTCIDKGFDVPCFVCRRIAELEEEGG